MQWQSYYDIRKFEEFIIEMNDGANENNNDNYRVNNEKTTASKSFEYKTNIIGTTPINDNTIDAEIVVPLKYLSNFLEVS